MLSVHAKPIPAWLASTPKQRAALEAAGIEPTLAGLVRHVHDTTPLCKRFDFPVCGLCVHKSRLYQAAKRFAVYLDIDAAVSDGKACIGGSRPLEWVAILMPPCPLLKGDGPGPARECPLLKTATPTRARPPSPKSTMDLSAERKIELPKVPRDVHLVAAADDLCCPITLERFKDPVVAEDGFTYERDALASWILRSPTSPSTGAPIGAAIVPNHLLRRLIRSQQAEVA